MSGASAVVGSNVTVVMSHATAGPVNVAPNADAEPVVDGLPRAEIDAGIIDLLDGNDVTQEEHGLFIEVHNHAHVLQWLRVRWPISSVRPGERCNTGQRHHLPILVSRSR